MHTEGEQKYCISHILKNIMVRPPSPPFSLFLACVVVGMFFFFHLAYSISNLNLNFHLLFFCFFGARHDTIIVWRVDMHEPDDVALHQYDTQRPHD